MKFLLLFLLGASAQAAPPQLICDEAEVSFEWHWFREASVVLSSGVRLELPWTGHETHVSASSLRDRAEEVAFLDDSTAFVRFSLPGSASLFVQRDLFRGMESDGLVIASSESDRAPSSAARVFHCRSR